MRTKTELGILGADPVGFDTASSIALLAISAIAQRGTNGESISHGKIVILPVRLPPM